MTDTKAVGKKAVKALAVVGSGKLLEKGLSFVTTIILARLLTPEDYGTMALAMIIIGFVSFINEIGVGSAIVQKPNLTPPELNGCFWISVIFSTILLIATALAAPVAAQLLKSPALETIIPILGIGFIFGGVATVSMGLLRKDMNYRPLVQANIVAVVIQSAVSIALAAMGKGVWALVAGFLVSELIRTIGLLIGAHWRPGRPGGFREAYSLASYGLKITSSRVMYFASQNADGLVIARIAGERVLGLYTMGMSLASIAISHITSIIVDVASPMFSKLQHDPAALSKALIRMNVGISYIVFPMLIGLAAVAEELVPVVLGENWLELTLAFQVFCFGALVRSVAPLLSQVLISTGHAMIVTRYLAWSAVLIPAAVAWGAYYHGLFGAAMGWALASPITYAMQLHYARKLTGLHLGDYFLALLPASYASIFMYLMVFGADYLCALGELNATLTLILKIGTGAASYVFWLLVISRQAMRDLKTLADLMGINIPFLSKQPNSI